MKSKLLGLALFAPFVLYACSDSKDSSSDDTTDNVDGSATQDGASGDDTTGDDTDGSTTTDDGGVVGDGASGGTNPIEGVTVSDVSPGGGFMDGIQFLPAANGVLLADFANGVYVGTGAYQATEVYAGTSPIAVALETSGKVLVSEASPTTNAPHRIMRVTVGLDGGTSSVVVTDVGPGGKKYHQPNDIATRKDGNFYFTDPDYFNHAGLGAGAAEYLPYEGIFRVSSAGAATLIDSTQLRPNGIAVSADGNSLFVGTDKNTPGMSGITAKPSTILKYTIAADGSVAATNVKFADTAFGSESLAIDDNGNVYSAGLGGIEVFKANGEKWGTLTVPNGATSIGFGEADRKTLYISSNGSGAKLLKAVVKVPGLI